MTLTNNSESILISIYIKKITMSFFTTEILIVYLIGG